MEELEEYIMFAQKYNTYKGEGIILELVREMLQKKIDVTEHMKEVEIDSQEHKSLYLKRQAVKGIVNTIYGVLAFPKFRLHKPELAKEVAELAREGIKYLVTQAKVKGYKVLLADTDSIFIQIPLNEAKQVGDTLNKEINKYFSERYGADMRLKLEFEKYIQTLLLTGVKKRYAMRISYNNGECDYIETKGFENIRTDQSIFTRSLLTELFDLIFYGSEKDEIRKFVQDKLEEFPKRPLNEIGISRGISKPFNEYKANTPHVRGAVYSNTNLNTNFSHGDKVQFLWVKGIQGYPPTNVVCFNEDTELPEGIVVDWKHMQEVGIIDKVKPILDAIGIDLKNVGKQQKFF